MLSGKRFRLKTPMLGIETQGDSARKACTIPLGAIITVISGPRPDDKRLVDVVLEDRPLVVFSADLLARGEEITSDSVAASA